MIFNLHADYKKEYGCIRKKFVNVAWQHPVEEFFLCFILWQCVAMIFVVIATGFQVSMGVISFCQVSGIPLLIYRTIRIVVLIVDAAAHCSW